MLAIELVRSILLVVAIGLGLFGALMAYDVETFDTKGNSLLILAAIALIVMFNI